MQKQKKKFLTEERRKEIVTMLAISMTETEIAKEIGVHVSTISRDITFLKKQSQKFIYDMAKSDLAFYYQQCLRSIDEAKRKAWNIYTDKELIPKEKILALKLIKECEESKFSMYKDGPFFFSECKNLRGEVN